MSDSPCEQLKKTLEKYNVTTIEWKEISIVRLMGIGGSCKVEEAKWKGQKVALKSLSGDFCDNNSEGCGQFIAEVFCCFFHSEFELCISKMFSTIQVKLLAQVK